MKHYAALVLVPALLLGACQQQTSNENAATNANTTDVDAVAWVNDQPISRDMFEFHLMRRTQGQPELAGPEAREALLNELVDLTLLAQEAENLGLGEEPEVRAQLDNLRQAVLAQAAVERLAQNPDEALIKEQYEQQYAEPQQEYHARHILVDDAETAQQLISELDEGADFAELAQEHSTGPTGPNGGDLGWFMPEHMVPPFAQAVQQLEPGQYTAEPVQTQFGFHVIKLEDTREQPKPEFDRVRDQLAMEVSQNAIENRLQELRDEADIRLADAEEASAVEQAPADETDTQGAESAAN